MLWDRCIELGIEARKKLREFAHYYAQSGRDEEEKWFFDPFVPDVVTIRDSQFSKDLEAVAWEKIPTEVIKREQQCWNFDPKSKWHGYAGYAKGYAMVDPNKLTLLTPGINRETGDYLNFGVPATVVANYLREQRVVPEKCDLNSILFLMTPAEDESKLNTLIAKLVNFKNLWDRDAAAQRGSPDRLCRTEPTLCRLHHPPSLQGDARLLSLRERQGTATPVLPSIELSRTRHVVARRLRSPGRQQRRLCSA